MFLMIYLSLMGPRNQGVTVPNGTTQGNFTPTCTTTLITSNLVH